MAFVKATRRQIKLKLGVTGASGSGKTYSALRLASGLGKKIAFIDTENGSASLYSDRFNFDVMDISPPFTDEKFIDAMKEAQDYDVVIIDSASHFWEGILELKDKMDARGGNSYTNWNAAGKHFKDILNTVLQSPQHVICCMRSKMDYTQEKDERGKTTVKKVGLAPIMRDGIIYEFTTVFDVDSAHQASASKDRTGLFGDNISQITEDHGNKLLDWLHGAASALPVAAPVESADPAQSVRAAIAKVGKERALGSASDAAGCMITKAADIPADKSAAVIAAMDALCNG